MPVKSSCLPMLCVVVLSGCGDDDGSAPADGATAPDGSIDVPFATPAPPAAPMFVCPAGWSAAERRGVSVCEPWPADPPTGCADGEARFVGEASCVLVGAACPAGDFPDDLPTDVPVSYVQAGAPGGGDGSRASPFADVVTAIGSTPAGSLVAIGPGTFDGALAPARPITLRGACVARTTITTTADTDAIIARGVTVGVQDLSVRDTASFGLSAGPGGSLDASGVLVRAAANVGLTSFGGGRLVTRDFVLAETRPDGAGEAGRAVSVETASELVLERAALDANHEFGVFVNEASTADLSDVAIVNTRPQPIDSLWGRALNAQFGAQVTVTRGVFERGHELAVFVADPDTTLSMTDVLVRDTRPRALDGAGGRGAQIGLGSRVDLTRVAFAGHHENSIAVAGDGTSLVAADLAVLETRANGPDGTLGRAIDVGFDAHLDLRRAAVVGAREAGIHLSAGPTASLVDVSVADVIGRESNGGAGHAVNVQMNAALTLTRAALERSAGGLIALGGTTASLTDLAVREAIGRATDGTGGAGLLASLGAQVDLERGSFERCRELGVAANRTGTRLTGTEIVIVDTLERACADDTCAGRGFGSAAGAFNSASLSIARFAIRNAALCGVHIAALGSADLVDGEVAGNPIGVCIDQAGYDLDRLTPGVVYLDNGINLDTVELPIPEPTAELETP